MKISKLFHWLYAILMLLPFLVFLPNAFYYGFNEHAVAQEKTEQVPIYYETNEINSIDDLVVGNVYKFNVNYNVPLDPFGVLLTNGVFNITAPYETITAAVEYEIPYITYGANIRLRLDNNTNNVYQFTGSGYIDFIYRGIPTTRNTDIYLSISPCENTYIKEYQPLTTSMSITDSMSYAWDSVWQNDLFSWSYGSFLTEPFIYIGNVFNVPVDNSLYYALSYWLDISIIWLCFDMVMYVPLLVHRWLDKGIVE